MRTMKGLAITDIVATALVVAIVGVFISMMLIISIVNSLTSEPQGIVVSFIKSINEPFLSLEALSHSQFRDRQIFEHLVAASATGSLQGASSGGVDNAISDFISAYKKSIYIVAFSSMGKNIFQITNIQGTSVEAFSCGDNAFCTDETQTAGGDCQVGKIKIDDTGNKCKANQICCQLNADAYSRLNNSQIFSSASFPVKRFDIVACGKNKAGICSPNAIISTSDTRIELPYCGNGFLQIDDANKDCEKPNNGFTPTCCTLTSSALLEKAQVTQKVDVPFIYKGDTLFEQKKYYCQDSRNEACNGEYVTGLCGNAEKGNSDVKCCVTDQIKCNNLNGDYSYNKYFCRDVSDCSENGNDVKIIGNICPDPDTPSHKSSYKCCTTSAPYQPNNTARTQQPKFNLGSCYLTLKTDTHYSGQPVQGNLGVSLG